jgi:hypothetical protein
MKKIFTAAALSVSMLAAPVFAADNTPAPAGTAADQCVQAFIDGLTRDLKALGPSSFSFSDISGLNTLCEAQTGAKVTQKRDFHNFKIELSQ